MQKYIHEFSMALIAMNIGIQQNTLSRGVQKWSIQWMNEVKISLAFVDWSIILKCRF